jgi:hypothetical protein
MAAPTVSLRDHFAGLAMQSLLVTDTVPGPASDAMTAAAKAAGRDPAAQLSIDAFELADQMLLARNAPAAAPDARDHATAMRLMKAAPAMARGLADLDLLLANAGHDADHPWRALIRAALAETKAAAA